MKQLLIKDGGVVVEEVPAPALQPGTLLVRTAHSCISSGTELSVLRQRATPLWRKALDKPEQIKKAYEMVKNEGLRKTWNTIEQKVNAPLPLGYSAAGKVIAVGEGVQEFAPGDLVACAGAQCAFHAEVLCVPVNLAVKLPEKLGTAEASTVALGAIALQGVRRLSPTLGETFVVFGLGLLGQLSVQLLKANGCRVIALDLDPARAAMAAGFGADSALTGTESLISAVQALTEGAGADGVLITASGNSESLLAQAFRACRKKGRVVLVGDVPLEINRADIYEKELDFLVSCSYGPGRYDRRFEEEGLDYPLPYVRWTETRNMHAYLQLLAEGRIRLAPLLQERFPITEAPTAFRKISESGAMTALLEYSGAEAPARSVQVLPASPVRSERLRLAVVGAGSFTRAMHAPILKNLQNELEIRTVVARQGHSARAAAELLGAANASTDLGEVLKDPQVDAVLIATRHDLHSSFALQCLQAGKHVFLEKPTALDREGLLSLEKQLREAPKGPVLFTGFNRRFSPAALEVKAALGRRQAPLMIQYTMNAGYLPKEHWVHGPEGGGRNLGEACHVYDLFLFWTGAREVAAVTAQGIQPGGTPYMRNDNFSATMRFADGSVATLLYSAMGNPGLPKESAQVFSGGTMVRLEDYKEVRVYPASGKAPAVSAHKSKGHEEEWRAFLDIVRGKQSYDPFEQFLATEISFRVEDSLRN